MTIKVRPVLWALSAVASIVIPAGAQVEDPLPSEALPAEPFLANDGRAARAVPLDPVEGDLPRPDDEGGVVVEAEIADEAELGKAKARDAKADAEVETALDRATKPKDLETALRVQIYLDEKRFGPGFLDGKPGKFTSKAVHGYNRSVGRVPDDWRALISEVNQDLGETYAMAVVPDLAKLWVNPRLPTKYAAQAALKRMCYRSYLEFMAERYHTSEVFLLELNGRKKVAGLRPRGTLKVPNIEPFMIEKLSQGRRLEGEETLSSRTVIIDTKGRIMFIYEKGEAPKVPGAAVVVSEKEDEFAEQKLIAMFPITPGKVQYIHHGSWAVANCFELPSWSYDKEFLRTGRRSKDKSKILRIPPGPNVPVGILWSGLTKSGIGIHGTSSPRTIGRSLSAGCIRLANWDAARFPEIVRPGAKVLIR